MQQSNKVSEYISAVCDQIRWKKAHAVISKEIEDHISDQKNAFIVSGLDEETATNKAIKEMGDPVLIGSEFDHIYRPKVEWSVIVMTAIMLLLGIAIRVFITYNSDIQLILSKNVFSIIIGIGCVALFYFLDFTIIGKYPKAIYFSFNAITIVATLLSPIYNGRSFYTQFLLLLFPIVFAGIIYSMRTKGYLGVILSGVSMAIPMFMGVMSVHYSSVVLFTLACLILLTYAIVKGWFNVKKLNAILLIYIPTVISSFAILFSSPYRLERLMTSVVPSLDPRGSGWIATITRKIITNAKFIGQGDFKLAELPVTKALPCIETDYLLTYLIHELGWISFFVIMAVLILFIIRLFILCSRQKSVLGKLVSTSALITFTMQIIIYASSNLGLPVLTQQTLPLISYGGTATIINMILIGILLSVFKADILVSDKTFMISSEKNSLFEIVDGKIIINLNTRE